MARDARRLGVSVVVATACALLAGGADGAIHTERLSPTLCKTVGGGKFVPIPGFPGERIDRRLLPDVRWLVRRYHVFITDGFSRDPVHSASGEHPLGLAVDIVPNKAGGGSWREVTELALWAEPRQSAPVAPFRWVGYDGDAGHGRGNHLHLSWDHSPKTTFGQPVRVVYTRICPQPIGSGGGQDDGGGTGGGGGAGSGSGGGGGGAGDTGGGEAGKPPPKPPANGGVSGSEIQPTQHPTGGIRPE